MYGGERLPFTKSITPEKINKIAEYMNKSQEAVQLGWKYYCLNDMETAIKRFNQAWLFNPENPDVWWGFGMIQGGRAKIEKKDDYYHYSVIFL